MNSLFLSIDFDAENVYEIPNLSSLGNFPWVKRQRHHSIKLKTLFFHIFEVGTIDWKPTLDKGKNK